MVKKIKMTKAMFTYILSITILLSVIMLPMVGFAKEGVTSSFTAGVAKVDLSPSKGQLSQKNIFMGGYGSYMSRGPAEGISTDHIYARALALKSGKETVVFLSIDTAVIGNEVLNAIRQGASNITGIPADNILISATHTHSGPDLNGLWGGVSSNYKQFFIHHSILSVVKAANQMKHATLTIGTTDAAKNLVINRRGLDYTDNELSVLQVITEDQTVATLVNFAVHPVVLRSENPLLSSDFVGTLERKIESQFGGTAIFINGAQGDVEPNVDWNVPVDEQYKLAEEYGNKISKYVSLAIEKSKTVSQGLSIKTVDVSFPVENPAFIYANSVGWFSGYASMRKEDNQYYFDSKISRITLGKGENSVEMVTLPGEALTNLGLDIRDIMPGKHKMLLGLTHDTLGYLIHESEWSTTGYEENVSLGSKTGDIVLKAIEHLY
jgi:hypothetical protein